MRLGALCGAVLMAMGISACTTVDLSQVAVQSEARVPIEKKQNVVERASAALTTAFRTKGWCSGSPQEKTQTAASVLLNGVEASPIETHKTELSFSSDTQLSAALVAANDHVEQTTKAAEVYLSMPDGIDEVDNELSLLETALLSAREAETRFEKAVAASGRSSIRQDFERLEGNIDQLKDVTDRYGDYARSLIANKSNENRS